MVVAGLAGSAVTSGSAVEDAASAAPPATVTKPPETVAKQRRMPSRLDQPRRRAFELRRHITVPTTARAAAAATCGGPAASHEKALAKKPVGAAKRQVAHAAPRAPFPLAAVGQEAPQAMARRMSTIAGMRGGEQLTSEGAFEATAGEKAEDAAEATPDEKAEDAEA